MDRGGQPSLPYNSKVIPYCMHHISNDPPEQHILDIMDVPVKRFGNKFWEENRRHQNLVVSIKKQYWTNYFATHCEKHDKRFWSTVSSFMSDKKFQYESSIILEDKDETISDASRVSGNFNDFFVPVASEIGFEQDITSTKDEIDKH